MLRKVIGVVIAGALLFVGTWVSLSAEQPGQAATQKAPAATPVNLNTATVADLEKLPGVGPATAARIIEYREKNGPFKKIEELMNVKGIGEKAFLKLKPLVAVAAPRSFA
jgi:competence protein ComEA